MCAMWAYGRKTNRSLARRDPYAAFDGFETQDVKPLSRVRHNLDNHVRIVMFPATVANHLGEVLVEESHVEHKAPKVTQTAWCASNGGYPGGYLGRSKGADLQGCSSPGGPNSTQSGDRSNIPVRVQVGLEHPCKWACSVSRVCTWVCNRSRNSAATTRGGWVLRGAQTRILHTSIFRFRGRRPSPQNLRRVRWFPRCAPRSPQSSDWC